MARQTVEAGDVTVDRVARSVALVMALLAASLMATAHAQDPQTPKVRIPDAGVPQVMTLQGRYVRAAYNNEGYVILGYRLANASIGEDWMLIDVGITIRDGVPNYRLVRNAISLETPDGKTLPLPSVEEYRSANVQALQARARVTKDSINYFPPSANRACRIGFFADVDSAAHAWDVVELSDSRACVGQLYFHIPGGIAYGQHWLNVKFEQGLVRVPFRILTKDEAKLLDKNYKSIEKQVEEAFRPKK